MSDIRRIDDWRVSTTTGVLYERLLGALGAEAFGSTVRDSVQALTAGARRIYLFEASGAEQTSLHYYSCERSLVGLFPEYTRWYLRQDPVNDAYRAAPRCSDVALQRVRPRHIASSGFRRRIFDEPGIVERISVVQRGPDAWRVLSVARHESDGCCTDREVDALVGFACLALPLLAVHRARTTVAAAPGVAELEERFAAHCAALTPRELAVCARAASGLSVEGTALELGIARTSVLTYRRRAYQRLQVTSALQLRGLISR